MVGACLLPAFSWSATSRPCEVVSGTSATGTGVRLDRGDTVAQTVGASAPTWWCWT